ncbi:CBS domain-containing protein [Balneatrix alpica]|uniref:HPP family protein n=1 Tax=Balneatrix alpica TaxID=75684 RepID=A0ABV5ZC13_9GAMM|nr:CBS domain-containing protein [Balneatrix alpica]
MKTVAELMSTKLQLLKETDTLAHARDLMRQYNIRNLPVVASDGQTFAGIISQRAILKESFRLVSQHGVAGMAEQESMILVAEVMARDVITATPETTLVTAGRYCMENKHGCLPILNDQGHLMGLITPSDYVRLCVEMLEKKETQAAKRRAKKHPQA